jgi:hypothetical protein
LKIRTSTSLTAAACTLCVVAASGTMAPQTLAAGPVEATATPTVSRSYELTALPSPFLLISPSPAGPPALAANTLRSAAAVPSVQSIEATPTPTPTALAAAVASPPTINDVLALASLPVQNVWTVVTTLGQLTNFVTPLNRAMALIATGLTTGKWDVAAITAQVQAAIDITVTAIRNIINLPATIITKDLQAIGAVFNPAHTAARTTVQTLRTTSTTDAATSLDVAAEGTDGIAAVQVKHTWESLQTTVRSDLESQIDAFDEHPQTTGAATVEHGPAGDVPTEDASGADAPSKVVPAKAVPAKAVPGADSRETHVPTTKKSATQAAVTRIRAIKDATSNTPKGSTTTAGSTDAKASSATSGSSRSSDSGAH